MAISGISSSSIAALYTPPPAQKAQEAKAPQQAPNTDSVSISPQALKLASDGDTRAQEVKESGAEKAAEAARKKA